MRSPIFQQSIKFNILDSMWDHFFLPSFSRKKDVFHCTSYKIINQTVLDKRYGEDGKRTNICLTCNKAEHWARNCPDKEKQT